MKGWTCPVHGEASATLICVHVADNVGLHSVAIWDESHERWDLLCERCASRVEPEDLEAVCPICQLFYARGQRLVQYRGPRPPSFASAWERLSSDVQRRTKDVVTRRRLQNLTAGTERSRAAIRLLPAVAHEMGGRLAVRTLEALQTAYRRDRSDETLRAVAAFLANADPEIRRRAEALLETVGWEVRFRLRGDVQIRRQGGRWSRVKAPEKPVAVEDQIKE